MGDVINLSARRVARGRPHPVARPEPTRAEFFFDLACPFTYLAAERVERAFDDVTWTPAARHVLRSHSLHSDAVGTAAVRRAAEQRAVALRMPLVWPEHFPGIVTAGMRAAACAVELGRGGPFVLAAARLAFCGGFDLEDPDTLAEAAAAAGVEVDAVLIAARNEGRDGPILAAGRRLLAADVEQLPALRVGRKLYWGEERVGGAVAAARVARAAQG